MNTHKLATRPNLDHLRKQAKALLAALAEGDEQAAATFRDHLPAAAGLSLSAVGAAGFRLADAQSAVARQTGFANWPRLARHVEQLRALEGTWAFDRLEVDGQSIPPIAIAESRLLIDGDRFRMESPEARYEGVFNIDVEPDPACIDIEFVEGPEAGTWKHGIFRMVGEQGLEICLDMNGRPRPLEFKTAPGSGHALELLRRVSPARPVNVQGGVRVEKGASTEACSVDLALFHQPMTPLLEQLQGEWAATRIMRDGKELPAIIRWTGRRVAKGNEVTISVGGQTIIHALVRLDEKVAPIAVDYYLLAGPAKGGLQHGIMRWEDEAGEVTFCMAALGRPRPSEFASLAGSGCTLSTWKRKR